MRRSIERALALESTHAVALLQELFNEATQSGTGFAAMDFGYAFDILIWDAGRAEEDPGEPLLLAEIIAEAIHLDIVPLTYLKDAEIFHPKASDEKADFRSTESHLAQHALLSAISSRVDQMAIARS